MRVVMRAVGASPRVRRAAGGLALRGHAVAWWGEPPPVRAETLTVVRDVRALWHVRAEVAIGDTPQPRSPAVAGWLARAECLVLPLEHAAVLRWGPLARAAWHSLDAHGLIEPAEAPAFRERPGEADPGRIGLWPDQPAAGDPDPGHPDTEILERACERALARHRARALRPAVFLDRDGTLVREVGYLADPGDLELLPGAAGAIREARAAGLPVVVISNQSGVGRGLFPLARVHEAMGRLRRLLRAQDAEPDAIYFCPHRPEAECACRKPRAGLLRRAADDLLLDLEHSVMIGDKRLDAATGRAAGGRGVLVRTGYGREEERADPGGDAQPEAVCDDAAAAVQWFLARLGPH